MNHTMNGYSEIFSSATKKARKFYKYYKDLFKAYSTDIEDLIQEAHFAVLELIDKNPNKEKSEIFKMSHKTVNWHLSGILRDAKNHAQVFYDENSDTKENFLLPFLYIDEILIKNVNKVKFDKLTSFLDDREKNIVKEVIKNRRTYLSLGDKYSCSKQRIKYIYETALKKIAENLNSLQNMVDKEG